MENKLPINWSFAGISLLFIILAGSILYFANNVTQKRQSTTSKAAGNQCIDGIVADSVQFLKPDGTVIQNGSTVDSLTGIRCKLRVSGIPEADKHNVCGIKINDAWPVGCPNVIPETDWIHENIYTWDTDVTTTFLRCDQSLTNVPAGAKLQAVVARFYPNGINCVWTDPTQFIPGPQIFFQSTTNPTTQPTNQPTAGPTTQPTTQPSTTPQNSQTSLYISPNPAAAGSQVTVTATGTTSCSTFISDPPGTNGFNNCVQSGGFSCSGNPQNDGKPCWWRWTCNASNTAGNYTATFTANNDSSCTSTASFTINSISCPRGNMGNLNCDSQGCIDNEDLVIFRTYFGKPGNSGNFFSDQSGIVDTGDFEILRQYFGTCSVN